MKTLIKLAVAVSVSAVALTVLAADEFGPLSITAMAKDVRTIALQNEAAVLDKTYIREAYIHSIKREKLDDGTYIYAIDMADKDEMLTAKFKELTFHSPNVYCVTDDKDLAASLKTRVLLPVTLTVKALVPNPTWPNQFNILASCNFEEAGAEGDKSARWE